MPGSPTSITSRPRPEMASDRAAFSSPISRWRPTNASLEELSVALIWSGWDWKPAVTPVGSVSLEGAGKSSREACNRVPHSLQNWALTGFSWPQLGQSMVVPPSPREQAIDQSDDTSGLRARQACPAWSGGSGLRAGEASGSLLVSSKLAPRPSLGYLAIKGYSGL